MLALIFAAAIASSDAGSQQGTSTQQPPPAASSVKPDAHDPNKLICSREEIPNTRMTRKVCRTQAEIDAQERDKDRFFQNMDSQSSRLLSAPDTTRAGS
jgi:hypothetical protein